MSHLDTAAAEFQRMYDSWIVQSPISEYKENGTYFVVGPDGTKHGAELSFDDATALRDQMAGRAAAIACVAEIVSAAAINTASNMAGIALRRKEVNDLNRGVRPPVAILRAIVKLMELEVRRDR